MKSYRKPDLECWLKYYLNFLKIDKLIVCDDNSTYDIKPLLISNKIKLIKKSELIYDKQNPSPQVAIYNAILETENINDDDIIFTPNDDEFWRYDQNKYNSFKECVLTKFNKFKSDTITVPCILMSSEKYLKNRNDDENFFTAFEFYAKINWIEQKPILRNYNKNKFTHVHYGNSKAINCYNGKSELYNGATCNTFSEDLKIYHYRITTIDEYKIKMSKALNSKREYATADIQDFCSSNYKNFKGFVHKDETLKNIWNNYLKNM